MFSESKLLHFIWNARFILFFFLLDYLIIKFLMLIISHNQHPYYYHEKKNRKKLNKDNEKTFLKMHFLDKTKTKNGRLEGNYLSILGQYFCHKKYVTNFLPSSFVMLTSYWLPFCYNYFLTVITFMFYLPFYYNYIFLELSSSD